MSNALLRLLAGAALLAAIVVRAENAPAKDRATREDYAFSTEGSVTSLPETTRGTLQFSLRALNGLKIHPEAPLELKFTSSDGLVVATPKLTRSDATEPEPGLLRFEAPVDATRAGPQRVDVELSFFLCTENWCQRMTDRGTVAVEVTPPPK
ncbi:MAG: hypothetical protein ACO3JL_13735 [Myxococcota bacterium]